MSFIDDLYQDMIVCHAGNMTREKPALIIQNRFLDFGFGFYTTLNLVQDIDDYIARKKAEA